jgi:hypothetical protein
LFVAAISFDLDTMPPIDLKNSDLYGIGIESCFVNSSDGFDFLSKIQKKAHQTLSKNNLILLLLHCK